MSSRLSFSYPEDMRNKIKALADADGRSISNYIQQVLEAHLKEQKIPAPKNKGRKKRDLTVPNKKQARGRVKRTA